MKRIIIFSILAFGWIFNPAQASIDSVLTITRHDTVFTDRLIIDNPEAIKKLIEPFKSDISNSRKICGWGMITAGICSEIFSLVNLTENARVFGDGHLRTLLRKTGFYEINICLSVGLIAAGVSMLFK